MKKRIILALCLGLCASLIAGCGLVAAGIGSLDSGGAGIHAESPDETAAAPAVTADPVGVSDPGTVQNSPPVVAGLPSGGRADASDEDILAFFRLVVFSAYPEGEPVYKWMKPIVASPAGDCDEDDLRQLAGLFEGLNGCEGFPGISFAEGGEEPGLEIRFVDSHTLRDAMPNWNGSQPVYAAFAESGCAITRAVIYVVPELVDDRAERNYLLTWGVFYTIGFTFDNDMFPESIFNPNYIGEQLGTGVPFSSPAPVDWRLVPMLYDEAVLPGMLVEEAVGALGE